ncbi:MAG: SLATT domain-containing protein [Acidimicrobiales bacterium]|nr:SLATT domain-containing protein [Acidimicrobiales bacterium]
MSSSPLGSADHVAAIRTDHPDLAALIDDLEAVVAPAYEDADAKAVAAQSKLDRSRRLALIGTAVAALASVLQVVPNHGFRIGAQIAVILAGAVSAAAINARRERVFRRWTEQRRIAEELRSLYFRELAAADVDAPSGERRLSLTARIDVVSAGGTTDVARPVNVAPGTELGEDRAALYGRLRLSGQIDWMRDKAEGLRTWADRLDGVQTGLTVAIPLLGGIGLLAEFNEGAAVDVPQAAIASAVVAGAATAIGAASASLGHERLAAHYERTVADLERYRRVWASGMSTDGLVEAVEQSLMREHRSWHQLTEDIERAGS